MAYGSLRYLKENCKQEDRKYIILVGIFKEKNHLGKSTFPLGKVPFGKVSQEKIHLGKKHPWEKSPLGKITFGNSILDKNSPWEKSALGNAPLG